MKCNQEKCEKESTHRVFWPGREPLEMCADCTAKAEGVGRAIGCYIYTQPIIELSEKP